MRFEARAGRLRIFRREQLRFDKRAGFFWACHARQTSREDQFSNTLSRVDFDRQDIRLRREKHSQLQLFGRHLIGDRVSSLSFIVYFSCLTLARRLVRILLFLGSGSALTMRPSLDTSSAFSGPGVCWGFPAAHSTDREIRRLKDKPDSSEHC